MMRVLRAEIKNEAHLFSSWSWKTEVTIVTLGKKDLKQNI